MGACGVDLSLRSEEIKCPTAAVISYPPPCPLTLPLPRSVEGEYIPLKEDRVTFRLCPIPPKMDRYQAIHVRIVNFSHAKHHKWNEPPSAEEREEQNDATFVN